MNFRFVSGCTWASSNSICFTSGIIPHWTTPTNQFMMSMIFNFLVVIHENSYHKHQEILKEISVFRKGDKCLVFGFYEYSSSVCINGM